MTQPLKFFARVSASRGITELYLHDCPFEVVNDIKKFLSQNVDWHKHIRICQVYLSVVNESEIARLTVNRYNRPDVEIDLYVERHIDGTYEFHYKQFDRCIPKFTGKEDKFEEFIGAWNQGFPSHPWEVVRHNRISQEELEREAVPLGHYTKSAAKSTDGTDTPYLYKTLKPPYNI